MKRIFLFFIIISICISCTNNQQPKDDTSAVATDTLNKNQPAAINDNLSQQDSIKATGTQVLTYLKQNNYTELVKFFASDGVRFVPYGYIDTANTKLLTPDQFLESIAKNWTLTWGSFDGTGNAIKLSVPAYLKKFGYNADYLNAEAVGYDAVIKQGNSINNIKDIYPNHHFIDYHFSGFEQKYAGMDWSSLRLVFKMENGQYFLVAIIHDQWTS